MANIQIYEQKDFTGGLNLRSDQFQLADNESPEMLNIEIDPRGGIFSRGGMRRITTHNVTETWEPHKVFPFYSEDNNLMLSNYNRVYYYANGNFNVLNYSVNGSTFPVTTYSSHGACFAPWGNTLYIAVGDSAVVKWNGSTPNASLTTVASTAANNWANSNHAGTGTAVPKAQHLQVHANKMFAAWTYEDGSAHPNRLRWSDESQPESWVKDDFIDIVGGGNGITGMVVVNGLLIIFKPYAIYALYGYDHTDFRLVNISNTIGCHDHQAMAATDSGVYFYSRSDGLFYFDGNNITDIFVPVRPMFDLNYINSSAEDIVTVSWIGRRVWLSLPYSKTGTVEYPTINLVFDPTIKAYTMFSTADNRGVVAGCDYRSAAGLDYRLMCHPTVPTVLNVDRYDDEEDAINVNGSTDGFPTLYRTKWFDAGSYMQRKMFRRPDLVMKETETRMQISVSVYHDFQESDGSEARTFNVVLPTAAQGMFWDEDSWATENPDGSVSGSVWSGGVISSTIKTAKNLGLSKTVQLKFEGELKKAWGINSIGYKWTSRRVKG